MLLELHVRVYVCSGKLHFPPTNIPHLLRACMCVLTYTYIYVHVHETAHRAID